MLDRSAFYGPVAQRKIAPFKPVSRLGKALARLPEPWIVFRQGGFSPTDGVAGTVYGGVYIALHPEKGMALIDLAPAQPDGAISGLRAALRAGNFPPETLDDVPVIALTLGQNEITAIAERLGEGFNAAPHESMEGAWAALAVSALTTRFPHLMQVERLADETSGPASSDRAKAAAETAPRAPRSGAARREGTPSRASATVVPIPSRTSPLRMPAVAAPDAPSAAKAHTGTKSIIAAAIVLASVAAAAAILLPMRQPASPAPDRIIATRPSPPVATPPAIATTKPAPSSPGTAAPAPAPTTAATTPLVPPPKPAAPPITATATASDKAGTSTASPERFFALPPPTKPKMTQPKATQTATSHSAAPHAAAPRKTATHTAPAATASKTAALPTVVVPPPPPKHIVAPRSKRTKAATATAAGKPVKHTLRRRREAAAPAIAPEPTITINGITYVKGREPHSLGTVAVSPASAADANAANTAPANKSASPAAAPTAQPAAIQPAAIQTAQPASARIAQPTTAQAAATAAPMQLTQPVTARAPTAAPASVPATQPAAAHPAQPARTGQAAGAPIQLLGPSPFDQP